MVPFMGENLQHFGLIPIVWVIAVVGGGVYRNTE